MVGIVNCIIENADKMLEPYDVPLIATKITTTHLYKYKEVTPLHPTNGNYFFYLFLKGLLSITQQILQIHVYSIEAVKP